MMSATSHVQTSPRFDKLPSKWAVFPGRSSSKTESKYPFRKKQQTIILGGHLQKKMLFTWVSNNYINLVQPINLIWHYIVILSLHKLGSVEMCQIAIVMKGESPCLWRGSFPHYFSTSMHHCCRLPPVLALFCIPYLTGGEARRTNHLSWLLSEQVQC